MKQWSLNLQPASLQLCFSQGYLDSAVSICKHPESQGEPVGSASSAFGGYAGGLSMVGSFVLIAGRISMCELESRRVIHLLSSFLAVV